MLKIQLLKNILVSFAFIPFLFACNNGIIGDVEKSHPSQQAPKNTPSLTIKHNEKNQLIVNWQQQSDAQNYTLLLSTSENFDDADTKRIKLKNPPYIIQPENTGQRFYAKIKSDWFGSQSADSIQQTFIIPPTVINDLVSNITDKNSVELSWTTTEGVESYKIYRQKNNQLDTSSATVIETFSSPFEDKTLDTNQEYFYWIVAVNKNQPSEFSNISSANIILKPLINQMPYFTSPDSLDIEENTIEIISLVAVDEQTETLIFSITGGQDGDLFSVKNGSKLAFIESPDFENPLDTDADNVYQIEVQVSDGELSQKRIMHITILDVEDTVVILPPEVTFLNTNIEIRESEGIVSLGIGLNKSSPDQIITVNINTISKSASTDDFIELSNYQVIFQIGETQKNIEIRIIDDDVYEGKDSETFTVTLSEVNGATIGDNKNIIVKIKDNDTEPLVPTANAGLDQILEINSLVTLDGTASLQNNSTGGLNFIWTPPSDINLSAIGVVQPTFKIPDNIVAGTRYTFKLVVTNAHGLDSEPDFVDIIVANSSPIVNAGEDHQAKVETRQTLNATISDPNGDKLNFVWSAPTSIVLSENDKLQTSYTIQPGTKAGTVLKLLLTAKDDQNDSTEDELNIIVLNTAPIALINLVEEARVENIVVLDASGSTDQNDDELSYLWESPSGILLSNNKAQQTTFTVNPAVTPGTSYSFKLTVSDNQGGISSTSKSITIVNTSPTADAGENQTAKVSDIVELNASASIDPRNDTLSYLWSPSSINLSHDKSKQATFKVPWGSKAGAVLVFDLVVTNTLNETSTDSTEITVLNSAPRADAGNNQSAQVGDKVVLQGDASSDPNNDKLIYLWSDPSNVGLSELNVSKPSFIVANGAKSGDVYEFSLKVDDNLGLTASDKVIVSVLNTAPTANAGNDQDAISDDLVTLDASGSTDPNNDNLKYEWSSADGIILSDINAEKPTFVVPAQSKENLKLTFDLVVNDGQASSNIASVIVTVNNTIPIAIAGVDQLAAVGDLIVLNASASSDPNNLDLTYIWTAPAEFELIQTANAQSTYRISENIKAGRVFNFSLTVNNSRGDSSSDDVSVTILNTPPIANAGENKLVTVGKSIKLDAGGSRDVNGDSLSYNWNAVTLPIGSTATLTHSNSKIATFTPDVSGIYFFDLLVADEVSEMLSTLLVSAVIVDTPEMVSITGGSFMMGDETSSDGISVGAGSLAELPVHMVNIPNFELGKYEVSFTEYDTYLKNRATNPIANPSAITAGEAFDIAKSGRGSRPVAMVSWLDVKEYLAWLNKRVGFALDDPKRYRLPSDAEWEYAARGGQVTAYSTGICINSDQANYNGTTSYEYRNAKADVIVCPATNIFHNKTDAVGSYSANSYGLLDIYGNVYEWVEDRCHTNYIGAPIDGSAWVEKIGICFEQRNYRGGSWESSLPAMRSASYSSGNEDSRERGLGFRIARTP